MKKYAKIDISGLFYSKNDCVQVHQGHSYQLEINNGDKFIGYSQYERPVWILKENVVSGYGVTYKKKIFRILNYKDLGLD